VSPPVGSPPCRRCESLAVVANGKRITSKGLTQTWLCRSCGYRFTANNNYERRHSPLEVIALALSLYFEGLSVRKVANQLQEILGANVGRSTVYRWVNYYGRVAAAWMDSNIVMTGDRWHIDETVIKINGKPYYLWNILDAGSRYLLATHVSRTRSITETRRPIKKAKRVMSQKPEEILTDGMTSYPDAIMKEFYNRKAGPKQRSPHKRVPSIKSWNSNNRIERLHGTQKERIKVMRGFDNPEATKAILEGWRTHYNLVRVHTRLGTTPGQFVGHPKWTWRGILRAISLPV
jgi:putative transposase